MSLSSSTTSARQPFDTTTSARPIPGWPGYAATDDGHVLGKDGRQLRTRAHWRTGHLRVRLYGPAAPERAVSRRGRLHIERWADVYVHVAVCAAFHGPPPFDGALVLHGDDDPSNNAPTNLRWGTRSENEADKRVNRGVDDDHFDWATGVQA